ncbi:flagellar M-ring protein FliF C-terminal domain-containing protein [Sphingosinicella sp.]|uniref:flagellar M-ring protein FliF C-terminal domain-containing protein n=1 Tax=Sphingosinicella sp. TaxID=1917971 RepID=UPI0035B49001
MEQAVKAPESKAPEQNGKPQLLLIALLCAAAALLGLVLLRDPAPAAANPAPTAAVPVSDRQTSVEARLREQVEAMIGAIVGRENVRAVVSVEIEPDQTRQVTEAGDPGTNSTETTTIRSSGQIRRLTVSVMVDGRHVEGPDGVGYQPRTKAELARFTRLAQGAVGFDAMRGDSLTVETVRFARAEAAPAFAGTVDTFLPLARALLIGILALAALFLILRMFGRRTPVVTSAPEPEAIESAQPAAFAFTNDTTHSPTLRRAGDAVAARPAAAAAVVRQWMSA